jgi:hypothetical protein
MWRSSRSRSRRQAGSHAWPVGQGTGGTAVNRQTDRLARAGRGGRHCLRHNETFCTRTHGRRPERTEERVAETGAKQSGPERTATHSPLSGPRYRGSNPCALAADRSESVQLLDVGDDGDLDAYMGKGSRLFVNDGRGGFTVATLPIPEYSVLRDLNGDGVADSIRAARGPGGAGFETRLSGGTRPFSRRLFAAVEGVVVDQLAFADVDGDGDPDVLYTDAMPEDERPEGVTHPSGVLVNDGTGRLADSGQRWLPRTSYGHVCPGDLNGDGFADLVIAGWDHAARVWLNDGKGRFSDSRVRLGDKLGWSNCAVADFDNDGDRDVFLVDRRTGRRGLWFNRLAGNRRSVRPCRPGRSTIDVEVAHETPGGPAPVASRAVREWRSRTAESPGQWRRARSRTCFAPGSNEQGDRVIRDRGATSAAGRYGAGAPGIEGRTARDPTSACRCRAPTCPGSRRPC